MESNLQNQNTESAPNQPKQFSLKTRPILKLWIVVGLCVVVMAAVSPLFVRATRTNNMPPVVPVAVAKVTRTDLARSVDFDAEFRPYQEIDLHAKVAGFVKEMDVDIGDRVEVGQLLATLEVPELQDDIAHAQAVEKRSEADVQRAKADYEETHLAYTRLVGVEKERPNLVAQQDIDNARTKDQAADAALAEAKEAVNVAKADEGKLTDMLSYTRITAPFAGVITKREANPGALIPGGTSNSQTMPLLRLSENDRLRLTFPVSVSYVSHIQVGQPVQVHIQSIDKTFSGTVSRFSRKVDTATRTMDVEVDVPNPDLTLVPGMYASVSVELDRHNQALAVPVTAVSRKETATVYVVDQQNEIQERIVTLGLETPTRVEVLRGLKEGELVMVGSRTQVQPGQRVEPKLVDLAMQ
jgi:RND family efflux transporter MFP subunit